MKQTAEEKSREERIPSLGRLGNPILLNFPAEEAAGIVKEKTECIPLGIAVVQFVEVPIYV